MPTQISWETTEDSARATEGRSNLPHGLCVVGEAPPNVDSDAVASRPETLASDAKSSSLTVDLCPFKMAKGEDFVL